MMCWWYLAVAHIGCFLTTSFRMEVFLSVGHAGHAAPQLPQCGKANDFEVCSLTKTKYTRMHLSRKRGLSNLNGGYFRYP